LAIYLPVYLNVKAKKIETHLETSEHMFINQKALDYYQIMAFNWPKTNNNLANLKQIFDLFCN